jgi:hypothetical protein
MPARFAAPVASKSRRKADYCRGGDGRAPPAGSRYIAWARYLRRAVVKRPRAGQQRRRSRRTLRSWSQRQNPTRGCTDSWAPLRRPARGRVPTRLAPRVPPRRHRPGRRPARAARIVTPRSRIPHPDVPRADVNHRLVGVNRLRSVSERLWAVPEPRRPPEPPAGALARDTAALAQSRARRALRASPRATPRSHGTKRREPRWGDHRGSLFTAYALAEP